MTNDLNLNKNAIQSTVYQIRIEGHLSFQRLDWLEGLTVSLEDNGDTLFTGPIVDQAALFGLLKKVRDLGMPLVSVNPAGPVQTNGLDGEQENGAK